MQVSGKAERGNKPDHQVVKQEQVQVPTIDLLVHIVKPLSFYQKPEDFVPQKRLPTKYTIYYKTMKLAKEKKVGRKAEHFITYTYLSFRRQILQAVAKSTILTELCAVPLSRCKKFSNC